jgi:hypothetical protein
VTLTLATSERVFGPSYCWLIPKSRDYDVRVRDQYRNPVDLSVDKGPPSEVGFGD